MVSFSHDLPGLQLVSDHSILKTPGILQKGGYNQIQTAPAKTAILID